MLDLHKLLNRWKQKNEGGSLFVFAAHSRLLAFSGAISPERRLIAGQSRLGPYQLCKHTMRCLNMKGGAAERTRSLSHAHAASFHDLAHSHTQKKTFSNPSSSS